MTDLDHPQLLGKRYQIGALLGRGGMSDVYAGTDTVLQRPVAVKILTDRSDDVRKRFLREAQAMARLNHPHIVAVYDAASTDGVSYIVMELVPGRTLATISPADLTVHTALRFILELLDAVAYAHESGVIHRDIKPANIMVLPDWSIKVMDFGLSRRASDISSASVSGEIVGTIAYLAPERFLGKVADARSDLYSIGVVMYEVFTGQVPFRNDSDDLVAVIFSHVNEQPVPLRNVNPGIPHQIDRIVLRLLEKDPERRYGSAREVMAEIATLLGISQGVSLPPAGPPPVATSAAAPESEPAAAAPPPAKSTIDILRSGEFARQPRGTGNTQTINEGYANALAGMLAARKRDWTEAGRAYLSALRAFEDVRNSLEYAKTALKYCNMIISKARETENPDRKEISAAAEMLDRSIAVLRAKGGSGEADDAERLLAALRRAGR